MALLVPKTLKGTFALLLCGLALVTVGLVTWQTMTMMRLRAELTGLTADLAEEYQQIAERDAIPLAAYEDLSTTQKKMMASIRRQSAELQTEQSLPDTLQDIIAMQIVLHGFANAPMTGTGMVQDGRYLSLQANIGERGAVRDIIEDYNTAAKRWNDLLTNATASVSITLNQVPTEELPYLHFLGQEDYIPVISL